MSVIRRWWKDTEGATAIEFGLLAVPFVFFVVGIIELALMNAAGFVMQGAVSDAARLIRTGQIQQSEEGNPEDLFYEALCDHAGMMLDCSRLQYTVEPLDAFANAEDFDLDEEGNLLDTQFDPGGVRDVVMIRTVYRYRLLTPLIGEFFSNYPGNVRLLMSTIVLETEPYEFEEE